MKYTAHHKFMLINILSLKTYDFHDFLKKSLINEIPKWFFDLFSSEGRTVKIPFLTKNENIRSLKSVKFFQRTPEMEFQILTARRNGINLS